MVDAIEAEMPGCGLAFAQIPRNRRDGEIDELRCEVRAASMDDLVSALGSPARFTGLRIKARNATGSAISVVVEVGVPRERKRDHFFGTTRYTQVHVEGDDEAQVRRTCLFILDLLRPTEFWSRKRRKILDWVSATAFSFAITTWAIVFVNSFSGKESDVMLVSALLLAAYYAVIHVFDSFLSRSLVLLAPNKPERLLLRLNRHHRQVLSGPFALPGVATVIAVLSLGVAVAAYVFPRT
ncbi:hypothetical protein [Streptomyces sp. NPDC088785]|uniref:hypothetical protein n=1 Tax=Streptomyces sp. NPDC088785 TaxID=3365897 RepID=UPI0038290662